MNTNTTTEPVSETHWFFLVMGDVIGPVVEQELRQIVQTNQLGRDSFVRCGGGEWMLADQVAGLFPDLNAKCDQPEPDEVFYLVMGEVRGPVSRSAWERLAASRNDIGRDTLIRCGNQESWVTADSISPDWATFVQDTSVVPNSLASPGTPVGPSSLSG